MSRLGNCRLYHYKELFFYSSFFGENINYYNGVIYTVNFTEAVIPHMQFCEQLVSFLKLKQLPENYSVGPKMCKKISKVC